MVEYSYVRLKTYNPRKGYGLVRYHFAGNLFVGGPRPTWYKVDAKLADLCRNDVMDNGLLAFDVVSETQKQDIDREEETRRLVALGLMSATDVRPKGPNIQDLREVATARAPGRSEAIPETSVAPNATAETFGIGAK